VGTPTVQMVAHEQVPFGIVSADRSSSTAPTAATSWRCSRLPDEPAGADDPRLAGFTDIGDIFKNDGTVAMQQGLPYANFLKNKYGFDKVRIVPSPGGDLPST
jgi:NitT/TauT family transport system substrate-binding protein